MTVAAWLSVYGDSWDCQACMDGKRRQEYVCPNRDGTMAEAVRRLRKIPKSDIPNVVTRLDYASVCPYMFVTPLVREFLASRRWFDAGNIGFSFLQAPSWYLEALAVYDMESSRAMKFRQAEKS